MPCFPLNSENALCGLIEDSLDVEDSYFSAREDVPDKIKNSRNQKPVRSNPNSCAGKEKCEGKFTKTVQGDLAELQASLEGRRDSAANESGESVKPEIRRDFAKSQEERRAFFDEDEALVFMIKEFLSHIDPHLYDDDSNIGKVLPNRALTVLIYFCMDAIDWFDQGHSNLPICFLAIEKIRYAIVSLEASILEALESGDPATSLQ